MNETKISVDDLVDVPIHSLNTIVVGSGAAAFNAVDTLFDLGQRDVAIVTEGINMGTSRNTGSDKQTYYKLSSSGNQDDSIYKMANTLFQGGSMHGDVALIEAALSSKCFYKLVNLGVPFPHDRYGQYIGYKTDHDSSKRAISCGPLTSKYMVECLEKSVKNKNIKIFDGMRVVSILTDNDGNRNCIGVLAINKKKWMKILDLLFSMLQM